MAYALVNSTVQLGRGVHSCRAVTRRIRFMRRSTVTPGTCWLKCIRSMTSRRKGEIETILPRSLSISFQRLETQESKGRWIKGAQVVGGTYLIPPDKSRQALQPAQVV